MACQKFEDRILHDLLPKFCDHPSQAWGPEGFRKDWKKIHDQDARDFLRGLDSGLIRHVKHGHYLAPKSSAKEMFFWVGSKKITPRPITLWAEPIITVAVLARLHFDLGWPKELVGAQSSDWAFDAVTFPTTESSNEHIACEVKKSVSEVEKLITCMIQFGANPQLELPGNAKELNAYKKVVGLRSRQAPLFWAVGPNTKNHAFRLVYGDGGLVEFEETTIQALIYSNSAAKIPSLGTMPPLRGLSLSE